MCSRPQAAQDLQLRRSPVRPVIARYKYCKFSTPLGRSAALGTIGLWLRQPRLNLDPIATKVHFPGPSMGLSEAELSPEASAGAVRKVIAESGPQHSGCFFNYADQTMPW